MSNEINYNSKKYWLLYFFKSFLAAFIYHFVFGSQMLGLIMFLFFVIRLEYDMLFKN